MSINKFSVTQYVLICMQDGRWWTYWDIQKKIKDKTNVFYSEATISAAVRNLRKPSYQSKFGLPITTSVSRRKRSVGKGNEYRLSSKWNNPHDLMENKIE